MLRTSDPLRRAIAAHEQAIAAREAGRLASSERLARRAIEGYLSAEGPGHPDVGSACLELGQVRELRDDLAEAAQCYRRARAILRRHGRADPEIRRLSIRAARFLGNVLRAQGRHAAADRMLARALDESMADLGPNDLETAAALNYLGMLRKYQGLFPEAAAFYRRATAIVSRSPERRGEAAATLAHNLGGLEHARGRHARGEPHARRSVALREALLGPGHPRVAADLAALAALVEGQGRFDEASVLYARALTVFRRRLGPASSEVGFTLAALGGVRQAQGRLGLAEKLMRRALAIQEVIYGRSHPEVALTLHNLGVLVAARGRAADARSLCRRSLVIFTRTLGPRHPHTRLCRDNLRRLAPGPVENQQR